jgi:hypothetical protein
VEKARFDWGFSYWEKELPQRWVELARLYVRQVLD